MFVAKVGAVLNTARPVPVSSLKTLANCAEVVAANCDNGFAVEAFPVAACQTGALPAPVLVKTYPAVEAGKRESADVVEAYKISPTAKVDCPVPPFAAAIVPDNCDVAIVNVVHENVSEADDQVIP